MNRITTLIVLLILLAGSALPQAKSGGIARQAAMGGSQAGPGLVLNPFIMEDPALLFINPAYQSRYKDYGWSNISGGTLTGLTTGNNGYGQQSAGISFGLTDELNIGAILSYDPSAVNVVNTLIGTGGGLFPSNFTPPSRPAQAIPAVANVWELIASYHLNSMDLGFGLMYGWSNKETKTSTTIPTSTESEASSRMFGFRAGLLYDLGGGSSLDASAAIRMDKATDKITITPAPGAPGGDGAYSASGTEIQFSARAKFNASRKFNFVPYGLFANLSADPKEDTPPTGVAATKRSRKISGNAYAIGVGGEFHTQKVYLAGGVSWQYAQVKGEQADSPATSPFAGTATGKSTSFPVVNIGAEWSFTDWLIGRAGYFRSIGSSSYKVETSTTSTETNGTSGIAIPGFGFFPGVHSFVGVGGLLPGSWDGVVTMGLGFKFGGWALDATISEEALRRGLGLIGAQDNINTFGYLTASYNFAE